MPDILIRNFPGEDLALLDEQARRAGLSRTEYLRRRLHEQAHRDQAPVTAADLSALAELITDLADAEVLRDAWS
ncbi:MULTISPECIES: antitoxin [unclassified Ornithinimicrobium]|uniref:type II toxin-antitoxin system VapB family antitoxin n=1 Tax=unclassified Ornithinimicrobium TaxID=2615080 RepID=UPI0038547880